MSSWYWQLLVIEERRYIKIKFNDSSTAILKIPRQ